MTISWREPPPSSRGDRNANDTYAAVGRALSAWEEMELSLARIYAGLIGAPPATAIDRPEYRRASAFAERARVIEQAGASFFAKAPDQDEEGDFGAIMRESRALSGTRNHIAHGVVRPTWGAEDLLDGHHLSLALDRAEYMLLPATYRSRDFASPGRDPAFRFAAADIDAFTDHVCQTRAEMVEPFAIRLALKRR